MNDPSQNRSTTPDLLWTERMAVTILIVIAGVALIWRFGDGSAVVGPVFGFWGVVLGWWLPRSSNGG